MVFYRSLCGAGGGAHLLPSAVTVEDYQDDTEEENIVEIGDNEED